MEDAIREQIRMLFLQLEDWPTEAHWFCPKRRDVDPLNYEDTEADDAEADSENLGQEGKLELISQCVSRRWVAYRLCMVYALPAEDAEAADWQNVHRRRCKELLTTCDRCVLHYHKDRKMFLREISNDYDDEFATQVSDILDNEDFQRICDGLSLAQSLLVRTAEEKRNARALKSNPSALIALYEALCCPPFHTSQSKLDDSFSAPFVLVQTNKVLRLGDILPAMTRFLFDPDPYRLGFATAAWQDLGKSLNAETFDWAVEDALSDAIRSVSLQGATIAEVQRFWEGLLLILDKLDKNLITHSLRGMEIRPDVYHLALLHLTLYDSDLILNLIIQTLRVLLLKSPKDFWDAYGAISATTIAEQVFASKAFDRLLARSQHYELVDDIEVPYALAWISPFVKSLPAAHQYDVCRSLLHHLFERFQDWKVPEVSKLACFRAGLSALLTTMMTFVDKEYIINASTSFIVVNNILGLIDKYKVIIVDSANLDSDTKDNNELSRLGIRVVRNAIALCCKSILAEFQALKSEKDIRHELESHSQSIWQSVLDGFRGNNLEMAWNILAGLAPLVGLDKLKPRTRDQNGKPYEDPLRQSKLRFNSDFDQVTETISRVFERLSDFAPNKLQQLCRQSSTAYPLFAALTPPDQATYEAAVEIIKTITGESGRKDAVLRLLQDSFEQTLTSLSWAARRIGRHETFAAVPYLLRTSRDVLDSLCDPQNGLLRTRPPQNPVEENAILIWWTAQWEAMSVAFRNYEHWALGSDTRIMIDSCRDTMEYAEALFDQYSVLASAFDEAAWSIPVKKGTPESSKTSRKELLEHPRKAMEHLVRWLRLKDSYLLSTLVSLLSKILRRLGEFGMEISTVALREVELVGKGLRPTYKVTGQEKAELLVAWEEHSGIGKVKKPANATSTRQGTIDDWSKSAKGAIHEPSVPARGTSSSSNLSDDVRSLSNSIEQGKSTLEQMRSRGQLRNAAGLGSKNALNMSQSLKESREKAKEERKRRDAKYLAEVNALRGHVPGEGSGIKGIGVQGKDHAPPRKEDGIMISSDEDSSDDGVDAKTLIHRKVERSKKVLEHEQSMKRALKQQQQGPVIKKKIARSAHDMRARLVPNMDSLHLTILTWDIFHEGEDPPNGIQCQEVSDTFYTPSDYYETFYPLLIAEAWRSLSTAKEDNSFKPFELKVASRSSVDSFFEVGTTMPIAENRDNNIMEGDIILLSKGQDPMKDRQQVLCLSRVYRVTRKKDVMEISYRFSGQASNRASVLSALSPNLKVRGVKITSMTTIEREYAALKSLEFYDLCEEILSAQPSPILAYPDQTLNPIRRIYGVNMGQARAIWSAKENDAFTLIQGPPGSGKTKTIVAMVGALLTGKFTTPGVAINHPRAAEPKSSNDTLVQKKLLICAPSNAAVDELVTRLKAGVKSLKGEFHKINVIRLGRSEAIDANVKDVTLDELVRAKMEGDGKDGMLVLSDREKLHQEAARLKEAVDALRPKLEEARAKGDTDLERRLQRDFDGKKRDQARIGAKIDDNKANGNTASRENEITRRRLQQEIIDSAHVLCATLSGSGHEMFKNINVEFETVIIDEAAQCIELSALIPLKYGCSKCILVGDPKQLPPTVLSRSAARYGYEQSLFVRMQQNHPNDVHLLDTQYRMHPEISKFPSTQFYDGKLIDGEGMVTSRQKPWHASPLLGPYRFFDVKGTQASGGKGHSLVNIEEVNVALQLYERLRNDYGSYDYRGKIGIITPYKAQLQRLRTTFQGRYGEKVFDEIEFNTTDAFQGRESEIIIFSCVRASASGGIGFLNDIRRMNVGLTRAKSSLWVLGDSQSLIRGEFWARLIEDAKTRQKYTNGDLANLLKRPVPLGYATSDFKEDSRGNSVHDSRRDSMDSSRRSSIASVQMTDAPDLVDERESSTTSNDNAINRRPTIKPKAITSRARDLRSIELEAESGAQVTLPSRSTHPRGDLLDSDAGSTSDRIEDRGNAYDSGDSRSSAKWRSKREREASPTDEIATASKKITASFNSTSSAPTIQPSSTLESATPSVSRPSNAVDAAQAKPRRPVMQGNVPPPRKRAPADPLLRNRPNRPR